MENHYRKKVTSFVRGDVVFVRNPNKSGERGPHVLAGDHPAVIIQNQSGNNYSPNLIIAFISSKLKRPELPTHVLLESYPELRVSMIQAEQIATVDKHAVLNYMTHLREEDMKRLDQAIASSLGIAD